MSLDTYANLQSAIADHLDRDDLTSQIKDFITLAEERHREEVRLPELLSWTAITVDDIDIALPTRFAQAISLRLLTNPTTLLEYVSPEEINRYRQSGTGKPAYYTIHSQIEFDIDPDSSYSGSILYYSYPAALSDSNTSNEILTRAPGLYLYGALTFAEPFLLNDERLQVWNSMYDALLARLNRSVALQSRISGRRSRVDGSTP